jgi:allantoate deiminase
MLNDAQLAELVMRRADELGRISDEPDRLTRVYGSLAMRRANDLVAGWMREAGMTVREDAIGNLIGSYPAARPDAKSFLLGSHLDTVRDAGKFDGPLGVLVALACVQRLRHANLHLPFEVRVAAFADEEGTRFHTSYLGSRVMAGTFDPLELKRVDADGVSLEEAILRFGGDPAGLYGAMLERGQLLGYAEVHIEQGPVLEKESRAVGVVSSILGQTRAQVHMTGRAGHAGTTPMASRQDALLAAAQFILMVEFITRDDPDLLATVGQLRVLPGASNVIPGEVTLSVDVRHPRDDRRLMACERLNAAAHQLAAKWDVAADWEVVQETNSTPCSRELSELLLQSARAHQGLTTELASGAGHDAAALAAITPVAMLFVRCQGGVSHHPDESVTVDDVRVSISVMNDFLQLLAKDHAPI